MTQSINEITLDQLSDADQALLTEAEEALKQSYAPYSNFYVGAALRAFDGTVVRGTNFENASFGATLCAERSALTKANTEGYRTFEAIAIITNTKDGPNEKLAGPCGMCRQMLFEAFQLAEDKPLIVIIANTLKTRIIKTTIADLLPLGFGPRDLT